MKNNSIGLSLIVRDEERFLQKCLNSCNDYFYEIVIVDTGSTDNTIKIAEKFTKNIFEIKWEGDFSKARNFAKSKLNTDWIFQLDADEEIKFFDKNIFNEIVSRENVAAFFVKIENIITRKVIKEDYQLRLFLNIKDLFWKYRVHEQITDSLFDYCDKSGKKNIKSTFKIVHYGYRPYIVKIKQKHKRNLELLRKSINSGNENFYLVLKYISILRKLNLENNKDEIIKYSKKFFNTMLNKNINKLKTLKPVKFFPYELTFYLDI